ncbi:hypothetical protein NL676_010007 [Syzygium grande]|nr:hypothetical protein NL676_010007 [Syzygium grande]
MPRAHVYGQGPSSTPPLISGSVSWTIEIEGLIAKRGPQKTTCRAPDRGRGPPRTIHPFPLRVRLCGSRVVKPRKPKSGVTCSFSLVLYPSECVTDDVSPHVYVSVCLHWTFRRHQIFPHRIKCVSSIHSWYRPWVDMDVGT